jgi:hypothetical protein
MMSYKLQEYQKSIPLPFIEKRSNTHETQKLLNREDSRPKLKASEICLTAKQGDRMGF